ncbi:hypothetical protein [Acinetobacter sp.]
MFRLATGDVSCIATDMMTVDSHHIGYMGNSIQHLNTGIVLQ